MICTIKWNTLNRPTWEQLFATVPRANLLQSYSYAKAICSLYNQRPRWGVVQINGQDAGLVQILEVGLFKNAIHAVMIDRGPLWFDGFGNEAHFEAFVTCINEIFPKRFGRKRRFIPEIKENPRIQNILAKNNFKLTSKLPYQTIWVDITQDLDALRGSMKKKWRNSLSKSERANLQIKWDFSGKNLPWLLQVYAIDKSQKGYDGPSTKLLRAFGKTFIPEKKMMIGRAILDGEVIAAIMLLLHGNSATYQIGWSSETGRENSAHHLLLWEGIKTLKDMGVKDFDLGGVNDEGAAGVKTFKKGLGGKLVTLSGLYT